jgi:ribokinase
MTIRAQRFPVRGETLIGSDFDMGPGGKGSNQAVGAARLGASSSLVALIGEDALGQIGLDLYAQEQVDASQVRRVAEKPTGVGLITLNAEGENHIVIDLGANLLLGPAHVDAAEELIRRSDVTAVVLEIPLPAATRSLELARRHGKIALLNPAPAQRLDTRVLQYVDVLTPNESELRILLGLAPDDGTDTVELAHRLQAHGVRTLVVTRGGRGALIVDADGQATQVPGFTVEVVDSTGAGDAFNSALAVALAEGLTIHRAVRFACAAGALACTRLGVIPSLPSRAAVDELLQHKE